MYAYSTQSSGPTSACRQDTRTRSPNRRDNATSARQQQLFFPPSKMSHRPSTIKAPRRVFSDTDTEVLRLFTTSMILGK